MFQNKFDRIRLFFRKDKEPYLQLYDILGFYPHDISLYNEALKHKSCSKAQSGPACKSNNERLEFLGDAVLGAVVTDILYEQYCSKQEGFLTTLRSKLVSRNTLNTLAVQVGLNKYIQHVGPVTSAHNSYMNGNAFEALIGAIYLDRGYPYCMKFMQERIFNRLIDIEKVASKEENFKSRLIEWCQKFQFEFVFDTNELPVTGKNIPKFSTEIFIEGIACGKGTGYSKKESQQRAAREAMKQVKKDDALKERIMEAKQNAAAAVVKNEQNDSAV